VATDGRAGRVELLLYDSEGQVDRFVVRKGRLHHRDVVVPVDWISAIDDHGVHLAVERAALDRLPVYRPDSIILADIDQALWADEVIRALDIDTIDVAVRDGVVILGGYTTTPINKVRAEHIAREVPGVLGVVNNIVTDDDVVAAVAQALAHDARVREQRITVHAEHGVVTLSGEVASADLRLVAEEVAASVPQVRGVINLIQGPGAIIDLAQQRVLQPQIGQAVYATDFVIGRVERVIISPRNRRVTAIVVAGRLPDPEHPDDTPPEYQVVIPIEAIQDVTESGVLLTISSAEAARCPDFDPTNFVAPAASWQPPYPYTHADILLYRDQVPARGDLGSTPSGDLLANELGTRGEPLWERISRGMPVIFLDGVVGAVEHVWLDSRQGSISRIAVRVEEPLPKDMLIPLNLVRRIDETGIIVEVAAQQLAVLSDGVPLAAQQAEPAGK